MKNLILLLIILQVNTLSSQNYYFEREAHKAKWEVSFLPGYYNNPASVVKNVVFNSNTPNVADFKAGNSPRIDVEDGSDTGQLIYTKPYALKGGVIKGWFSKIGFLKNTSRLKGQVGYGGEKLYDDYCTFKIFIHYYIGGIEKWDLIWSNRKYYNGTLVDFDIDLASYSGQAVFFELRVDNTLDNTVNHNLPIWNDVVVTGNNVPNNMTLSERTFFLKSPYGNNYLEVISPWTKNASLQVDALTRALEQKYQFKFAGEDYYYILNNRGKALTVDYTNPETGKIFMGEMRGLESQKWKLIQESGNIYSIKSKYGNFLEVRNNNATPKTPVRVWVESLEQKWILEPVN